MTQHIFLTCLDDFFRQIFAQRIGWPNNYFQMSCRISQAEIWCPKRYFHDVSKNYTGRNSMTQQTFSWCPDEFYRYKFDAPTDWMTRQYGVLGNFTGRNLMPQKIVWFTTIIFMMSWRILQVDILCPTDIFMMSGRILQTKIWWPNRYVHDALVN